jgi:hypothetical protein
MATDTPAATAAFPAWGSHNSNAFFAADRSPALENGLVEESAMTCQPPCAGPKAGRPWEPEKNNRSNLAGPFGQGLRYSFVTDHKDMRSMFRVYISYSLLMA